MADFFTKFIGKINRRLPPDEGDFDSPILRENWLARDGRLSVPPGNTALFTGLSDTVRWLGRYHNIGIETIAPKTFAYTEDGLIYVLDDFAQTATNINSIFAVNAYPKHWMYKTADIIKLYFVDGQNLYSYDGNANNKWEIISITDTNGNTIKPIDIIEHKDRLILISKTDLYISRNLYPETFNSATDSLHVIVGSGKGQNLALSKLEDKLYILNTEGIFVIEGDIISALASTFEVRLVEQRNIIAGRTAVRTEKAIIFLADDFELWSWDGSQSQMLSYELKLKDFINPAQDALKKAVAVYHNNYYKMSFVEKGEIEPNTEVWWDALEDKIDIVRGRNIACYMKTDQTVETEYMEMGLSNVNSIVRDNRGTDFNGTAITKKLRTRDITVKKGHNVRFTAFYPQIMPTGNRNLIISYLLDGRSSNPAGADAYWIQNLEGEIKTLGSININNQAQFTGRIRPKIKYSRGESIAFDITDSTLGLKADFLGIGIDYELKEKSKGKTVGA